VTRVAREGDVSATPGVIRYPRATVGTWQPGTVTYTTHPKLRSRGAKAISQAQCPFTFLGTDSSGTAVKGDETVTLDAATTKLQGRESGVITDGDSVTSTYGNRLTAVSDAKLATRG
jgi:hypothetical protein